TSRGRVAELARRRSAELMASTDPAAAWRALAGRHQLQLAVSRFEPDETAAAQAAGRRAAALCFEQLGLAAQPVGRADDGRAIWPAGYIGSISHRAGVAVAALAPSRLVAVGVDLEQAGALPAADADLVLSVAERRLLK